MGYTVAAGSELLIPVEYWTGTDSGPGWVQLVVHSMDSLSAVLSVNVTGATPTPLHLVTVNPGHQERELEPGSSVNFPFTITNAGDDSATVAISRICSGSAIASGCGPATENVLIQAGSSVERSISIFAGTTNGATGEATLSAELLNDTLARDSGSVQLSVVQRSPGVVVVTPDAVLARDRCLTVAAGAGAAYECADLRAAYALPTTMTFGKARTPVLYYNSSHAHPFVRMAAEVTIPTSGGMPENISANLRINGAVEATGSWAGEQWTVGGTRQIALSFDASSKATGLYPYQLEVTRTYSTGPQTTTASGELVIVNRIASPFGAGWWLAGLEQLVAVSGNRFLWIGGDGSTRVFAPSGVNLWATAAVDRPETLEFDGTVYCRRLKGRGCIVFNMAGQQIQSRNVLAESHPWAHRTNFLYQNARLATIELPVLGDTLRYEFAYDANGRIDSVRAPGLSAQSWRTTTIAVSSTGDLTSICDPWLATVGYGYSSSEAHQLSSITNRRGFSTTFSFGSAGVLASVNAPIDSVTNAITTFVPHETRGLSGSSAVTPQEAYSKIDGPRLDVGDSTLIWHDRLNEPRTIRDAYGNEVHLARQDPNFPALVTETRTPSGFVQRAAYDAHGNVDTIRAVDPYGTGEDAVTTYTWDNVFDHVTSIKSPEGEVVNLGYSATTGLLAWRQQGSDQATRVSFAYDSLFLLSGTINPGPPAGRDTISYDSLLNVRMVASPTGIRTYAYRDGIGRDTLLVSPTDLAQTYLRRTSIRYDVAGHDTLTVTTASDGARSATIILRKVFNPAGNGTTVATLSDPDINGIGWITRDYTFDRANRQLTESLHRKNGTQWTTSTIPFSYDLAGNLLNGGRSGRGGVHVTYDALNRPVLRTTTGDSALFVYDESGALRFAASVYSRIRRGYYPAGALQWDSSWIATSIEGDNDFSEHAYGLAYEYDLDGRRTALYHPLQLRPAGTGATSYHYDPLWGALSEVEGPLGHSYQFLLDNSGRVVKQIKLADLPSHIVDSVAYNEEWQVVRRKLTAGQTVLHDEVRQYTAGGRLERSDDAASPLDPRFEFGPMGGLIRSFHEGSSTSQSFTVDPLGNRRSSTTVSPWHPEPLLMGYEVGSGRLLRETSLPGSNLPDTTRYEYGHYGVLADRYDTRRSSGGTFMGTYYGELRHTILSYYGNDRLKKTRLQVDSFASAGVEPPSAVPYHMTEEYRYDALGRRIWTRVVRGNNCPLKDRSSGCHSSVTRVVWDGSQMLYEIRMPGDSASGTIESDSPASPGDHYGVVGYVHAGGIDQPLALWKGTLLIVPHTDARGAYDAATCPVVTCDNSIYLPQENSGIFWEPIALIDGPPSWNGSLIEGMTDASGLQYKRNRYYDPGTGRFTQEDPIGLAGGLNVYGFAGGDPVNFSDPFGLCPSCIDRRSQNAFEIGFHYRETWMALGELWRGGEVRAKIKQYDDVISSAASANGVDGSLIKAIIYEEQTHRSPWEAEMERLGYGRTVGLGQLTVGTFGTRSELLDPATNINAMAAHLHALQAQGLIDSSRPEASLATKYNCGSCDAISDYGERVERFRELFSPPKR